MHEDVILWHGFEIRWLADEVGQASGKSSSLKERCWHVALTSSFHSCLKHIGRTFANAESTVTACHSSQFSPQHFVNLRHEKLTSYHFRARRGARELSYEMGDTDSGATNVDLRRKA